MRSCDQTVCVGIRFVSLGPVLCQLSESRAWRVAGSGPAGVSLVVPGESRSFANDTWPIVI